MANLTKEEILEGVSKMSVLELTELIKSMEDRFGVTAAAPVAAAAALPLRQPEQLLRQQRKRSLLSL